MEEQPKKPATPNAGNGNPQPNKADGNASGAPKPPSGPPSTPPPAGPPKAQPQQPAAQPARPQAPVRPAAPQQQPQQPQRPQAPAQPQQPVGQPARPQAPAQPAADNSRFMPGASPVQAAKPAAAPASEKGYKAPSIGGIKKTLELEPLRLAVDKIKAELRQIIIGQHQLVEQLIIAILADGHVLIEGVPGVAKTLTAKLLAQTISVEFKRIQFTPDLMPSDVIGTSIYNQKTNEFEYKRGPIFANLVLIDEINRAPAKTQAALFEAMEERQITVDGTTYKLEEPFMILATQNPVEQEGTYRLPEAQLDRFLFKIEVHYPQLHEEQQLLHNFHARNNKIDLDKLSKVLTASDIIKFRELVAKVHVDTNLINYIAAIVHQTRDNMALFLGASPRASISILAGAKAAAAVRGREYVTPDDIKFIAYSVLKHRIILTPEKEMEGVSPNEVIRQIVETVEVPR